MSNEQRPNNPNQQNQNPQQQNPGQRRTISISTTASSISRATQRDRQNQGGTRKAAIVRRTSVDAPISNRIRTTNSTTIQR